MDWSPLKKPAEVIEDRITRSILLGDFPPGSNLPAERQLAEILGVTRPTLREALQRLSRDGWVEIRHGLPTRVCDLWRDGNLRVLGTIARQDEALPDDFIPNLLQVRALLAPAYTRLAVEVQPGKVAGYLEDCHHLPEDPAVFSRRDWELHHLLTTLSGNPIFTLILNGFKDLYLLMAPRYFVTAEARAHSRGFYRDLQHAACLGEATVAEDLTRRVMEESLQFWSLSAPSMDA